MTTEQNQAIVRRRVEEIWNQGNLSAIDDLIAADFVSNGQPIGREGFRQFVSAIRTAFPDLQFTIEDIVAEGDKVCARYVGRGTQQGVFAGLPASGKPVEFAGIDIFRIAGGQFAEEWLMYDQLGLLQQLGAIFYTGTVGRINIVDAFREAHLMDPARRIIQNEQCLKPNTGGEIMNLTGQVALITGGSRGLGKAFAQALAMAGARVVITGRSTEELTATAAQIAPTPDQVLAMPADVTDPERTQQVIATVEEQVGPIDLLVNNAGVLRAFGPIGVVDPAAWWYEIEVNLRGPFLYTHAVLPAMRARQSGRIINVASGAGLGAIPSGSAYNVSKTALIRLSETLVQETQSDGICVFAIHPGTVRTPMNAYVHDSLEATEQIPQIQQWFRELYATDRDTPIEKSVDLVLQIAAGKADALSGCYLSVEDDIAALTQQAEIIQQENRRKLRIQM